MTKSKKRSNQSSSKVLFMVVSVIALSLIALVFLVNIPKEQKAFDINYENQPFIGEESAVVSIIEFGDYKCPACKNFNESMFPAIKKDLVDTGKAKFYFMNFPFINVDSARAAKFAETVYHELGNEVFWNFHHLLYERQPEDHKYERIDLYTEEFLKDILTEVASTEEVDKVVNAFKQDKYDSALETDLAYVKEIGVQSTPTLIINGKMFEGDSYEEFLEMVEQETKHE